MSAPPSLKHRTERGRIRPWRKHKLQSLAVADAMIAANEEDHGRRADRVTECANRLDFVRGTNGLKLHNGFRCKVRLCPTCAATKARQDYAVLAYRVTEHAKCHPRSMPVLLTLTVKNVPVAALRQAVTDLLTAFRRLTRKPIVKRAVIGWHRSLEVTFNEHGEAHPHLHVLMFMQPHYFAKNSSVYLTQKSWTALWCEATGQPLTIVDVRRMGRDRDGVLTLATDGLFELTKYLVKPTGFYRQVGSGWDVDPVLLDHLHHAVHRRRLRDVGGTLRKIRKPEPPKRPTDAELEAAHVDLETYLFGDWVDVWGELHGPDYWERAPPDKPSTSSAPNDTTPQGEHT